MSKIKRRGVSAQVEKQMLTGMIVSDRFLREVQSIYKPNLIRIPYVKIVAQWCLDYWEKYEKAPNRHIQDLYNNNKRSCTLDGELLNQIGDFLADISDEFDTTEHFNVGYILDCTEECLRSLNLKNLADDINMALLNNDLLEAETSLSEYNRVALPSTEGIQPFESAEDVRKAFEDAADSLFRLPGALGQMLNRSFIRGGFIGFMGPEKRGKSFTLIELAITAYRNRCNVAFIGMGDMSEHEITRRIGIRAVGRSDMSEYCGRLLVPIMDCVHNQCQTCPKNICPKQDAIGMHGKEQPKLSEIDDWIPCVECRGSPQYQPAHWWKWEDVGNVPLTWREAFHAMQRATRRTGGKQFRVLSFPNGTMNFHGVENQLSVWENLDGFVPDVIVVDYADIMAAEPNSQEGFRHQENERWRAGRALAQKKHCLVLIATQSDTASYDVESLSMRNFSEDKRKFGHVTGMVSLNQTEEEQEMGLLRMGWLVAREQMRTKRQVVVLQSLKQGRPFLGSHWSISPEAE